MKSLLFISELYFPEETSTGFIVTAIAEALASGGDRSVRVLCSQPTYMNRGDPAPRREIRGNVSILRVGAPKFNKNGLLGRLWNALSLTFRMASSMTRQIHHGDIIVVLTNPPSLPFLACWIARLKRATPILLVHDLYPDVFVPAGLLRDTNWAYLLIDKIQCSILRRMAHIVVLGRDMKKRVIAKDPRIAGKVSIIPNWGEIEHIHPNLRERNPVRIKNNLEGKFVVQYSGNLGRTHGISDLVQLADKLRDEPRVHFLVVGWGAEKNWLQKQIRDLALNNMTIIPPCRRKEYGKYVSCCDLFFLPLKEGMEGISVPSRTYNVMAAGVPILAACSENSELALIIREEKIGYVSQPGKIFEMEGIVRRALEQPDELAAMGERSRIAVEKKYTKNLVVRAFQKLIEEFDPAIKSNE